VDVEVTTRGDVGEEARRRAQEKIGELDAQVSIPMLRARVVLTQEENPRIARASRAEGEVDLNGRLVRARVAAVAMPQAVDELTDHLLRQLRRSMDRHADRRKEPAQPPEGTWRHGAWAPERAEYRALPAEEREIMRRKSFSFGELPPTDAAAYLEDLDHDFYLFTSAENGVDAVIFRHDDGSLGLIQPAGTAAVGGEGLQLQDSRMSGPISLDAAVAEMNELNHRFLFFINEETDRGNVIYRRHDGHYGLIEPAT